MIDRALARTGFWPVYGAFWVLTTWLGGTGEHRPLWAGFANLVAYAIFPLAVRASALRRNRPWPRRLGPVARFVVRWRSPLAVAYGLTGAWFAQWHYDVAWFSVMHGLASAAGMAAAARPLSGSILARSGTP